MLRLRLLLESFLAKNVRSRLSRLLLGETRRSLSAAHVSLLQHRIKTHQRHCPGTCPSTAKSTGERLLFLKGKSTPRSKTRH